MNTTDRMPKNYNISFLKLLAAIMVMAGHNAFITATNVPVLFGNGIHIIGVKILLTFSGYLICKSWENEPEFFKYIIKRVFRLLPQLIVYLIFAAYIVGPFLTELPAIQYLTSRSTFLYVFYNAVLHINYSLPGIFETNPYPVAVNGSLWTLPIEFALYLCVPIGISLFGRFFKKKTLNIILAAVTFCVCAAQILNMSGLGILPSRVVIYATDWMQGLALAPYFLVGMCFSRMDFLKNNLNTGVGILFLLAIECFPINGLVKELILTFAIPYFCFSFAFELPDILRGKSVKTDISYGIYLYGFFIQQTVTLLYIKLGWNISALCILIISIAVSAALAYISARFIDRPIQKIKTRLLMKLNKAE